MPQGSKKFKMPTANSNKRKKQKIVSQTKKGGRHIAPKKAKLQHQAKVKKGLEAAIKNNIEQEIKVTASKEGKPFKVIDAQPSGSKKK
ncbi:hypothetical protein CHUAL_004837 [Chamberlinius hualienensis]